MTLKGRNLYMIGSLAADLKGCVGDKRGSKMTEIHCQVCGTLPSDGDTCCIGITVPTKDYRGRPLETPGVHFACRKCRQAIAVAEKEQKWKRKKEGEVAL